MYMPAHLGWKIICSEINLIRGVEIREGDTCDLDSVMLLIYGTYEAVLHAVEILGLEVKKLWISSGKWPLMTQEWLSSPKERRETDPS